MLPVATSGLASPEISVLKSDNFPLNVTKNLLTYVIAPCLCTAGLFGGYASMPLSWLEEASASDRGFLHAAAAPGSLYLAKSEMHNPAGSSDIADILKENPALLCPVELGSTMGTVSIRAEYFNSDGGSMPDLSDLNDACPARMVIQR
ncbi:MAG: hypothetical protein ACO214_12810 [Hylemonella sp.]